MNSLLPISIVSIVLGILLFAIGYFFRIMHWPDMFYGIISGPAFFFVGTILLVVRYVKPN